MFSFISSWITLVKLCWKIYPWLHESLQKNISNKDNLLWLCLLERPTKYVKREGVIITSKLRASSTYSKWVRRDVLLLLLNLGYSPSLPPTPPHPPLFPVTFFLIHLLLLLFHIQFLQNCLARVLTPKVSTEAHFSWQKSAKTYRGT